MKNLVRNIFRGRKQQCNIPDVGKMARLYDWWEIKNI